MVDANRIDKMLGSDSEDSDDDDRSMRGIYLYICISLYMDVYAYV
jgi:hypothetical protein